MTLSFLIYIYFYLECWDNEPDNRPTINQVVERLKSMVSVRNQSVNNYQTVNSDASFQLSNEPFNSNNNVTSNNSLHGELSKLLQNFDKMNTNEIVESLTSNRQIIEIVDEIVDLIIKLTSNEKGYRGIKQGVFNYFTN